MGFHIPSGWTVAADMMKGRCDVAKEWMRGMEVYNYGRVGD